MLQKKYLTGNKVEVTFRMPPLDEVVELYLCGDFNDWQVKGVPLTLETDGTWVARLVLDGGRSYHFRYHDNQQIWHTDYEADGHSQNAFGTDDSILDLTARGNAAQKGGAAPAARQTAARKAGSRAKQTTDSRKVESSATGRHAAGSGKPKR